MRSKTYTQAHKRAQKHTKINNLFLGIITACAGYFILILLPTGNSTALTAVLLPAGIGCISCDLIYPCQLCRLSISLLSI